MRNRICFAGRIVVFAAVLEIFLSCYAGAVTIAEYAVPSTNSTPFAITAGSDGALWFTSGPKVTPGGSIWRITTTGGFTEYPIPFTPPPPFTPRFITPGPDGALWYTAENGGGPQQVQQITTGGIITSKTFLFGDQSLGGLTAGADGALWLADPIDPHHNSARILRIPVDGSAPANFPITFEQSNGPYPVAIAAGPDGALWFTGGFFFGPGAFIGRITTAGNITTYPLPAGSGAQGITTGADGALWFTEGNGSVGGGNKIGRITTSGVITEYPIPTPNAGAFYITNGPDGALWFTEQNANQIGRITTAGVATGYPIPTANSGLGGITTGPDGALWFTEANANTIGRLVPDANVRASTGASLSVTSSHAGSFVQGQSIGTYTLSVSNVGSAATDGMVSVADILPAGLTAIAVNGSGWMCTLPNLTCARSDSLPPSATYPPITLTVSVAPSATSPLANQVDVSGGGAPSAEPIAAREPASTAKTVNSSI